MPSTRDLLLEFIYAVDLSLRVAGASLPLGKGQERTILATRWNMFCRLLRSRLGPGWMLPFSTPPAGSRTYVVMFWDRPCVRISICDERAESGTRIYRIEAMQGLMEAVARPAARTFTRR